MALLSHTEERQMPISTFTICPGNDRLPVEDVISDLLLEQARARAHGVYINGMSNLGMCLANLNEYSQRNEDPNSWAFMSGGAAESMEGFIEIVKSTLSAIVNFIKELLKKLMEFFGSLFGRTGHNCDMTQANIRTLNSKIVEVPESRRRFDAIEIEPACPQQFFIEYAKSVTYLLDTLDKAVGSEQIRLYGRRLLNSLQSNEPVIDRPQSVELILHDQKYVDSSKFVGLEYPNFQVGVVNSKSLTGVVFGSTLKSTLGTSNRSTMSQLGYSPESLTSICNDYVIPLESKLKGIKTKVDNIGTMQVLCKHQITQLHYDKRFVSDITKTGDTYKKITMLTEFVADLGTIMILYTKISCAADEVIAYHKILSTAAANGV